MPKKKNFETQLERLQAIVQSIEDGSVTLEEALKLFEEGVSIYADCNALLEKAEQKIEILTEQGQRPFEKN